MDAGPVLYVQLCFHLRASVNAQTVPSRSPTSPPQAERVWGRLCQYKRIWQDPVWKWNQIFLHPGGR